MCTQMLRSGQFYNPQHTEPNRKLTHKKEPKDELEYLISSSVIHEVTLETQSSLGRNNNVINNDSNSNNSNIINSNSNTLCPQKRKPPNFGQ